MIRAKGKPMKRKRTNIVYILISTDFTKAVCKGFSNLKSNPFYGVYTSEFDYKLENEYLTFIDESRALNAINHFYLKELAEKELVQFRVYSMRKN